MERRKAMSDRTKIDPGWKWDDRMVYSQAVQIGKTIYVSGQIAVDAEGNVVGKGDMKAQTRAVLENLKTVLQLAGASLQDVVKRTAFYTDLSRVIEAREVIAEYFSSDLPPARTGVEVKGLGLPDLLLEIEAVAIKAA
jgi:reactive intermediate/imine deaminase